MAKKKKSGGRPRGKGGYHHRNRRQGDNRPPRQQQQSQVDEREPQEHSNGEPLPLEPARGILELHPNGYGFLRGLENNYARERTDPFVPATMIEKYRLREGLLISG